jgi:hypothetical protein
MPLSRLTGSDHSNQRPAPTRSSAVALRRHAPPAAALQAHPRAEPNGAAPRGRERAASAAGPLDRHITAGRARLDRPNFARLHASIIERQADWGWHNALDPAQASPESGPIAGAPVETGSARRLWFGGLAFALLAAGAIALVAAVHSGRLPPFETWARGDGDLIQRTLFGQGALSLNARVAAWVAGAPERAMDGAPAADREGGEVDAALASDGGDQPPEIEIEVLGPILGSAAAAAKLAASWPVGPTAAQTRAESRSESPLLEPPRPVLKPMLVSAVERAADRTGYRRSRP